MYTVKSKHLTLNTALHIGSCVISLLTPAEIMNFFGMEGAEAAATELRNSTAEDKITVACGYKCVFKMARSELGSIIVNSKPGPIKFDRW